jgi:predicted glutamine amidotransferase
LGATDSEEAFCFLLDRLSERGHLQRHADFEWLHRELLSLNRCGKLNCLMSDGESLFCYHDTGGHQGLVWTTIGVPAHHPEHFQDTELAVDFESGRPIQAFLVATRPLGKSRWTPFQCGQLIIAQRGLIIYSGTLEAPDRPQNADYSVGAATGPVREN